jgi:hypothetical protein
MPAPRTSDERFLKLLERMPAPMDTGDIASTLGWTRQNVQLVGSRLERAEKVVRLKGERDGSTGRPADSWALTGTVPKGSVAAVKQIAPDSIVITPTGEEARVIGAKGKCFVEFEYITGPERFQRGTLHVNLLREYQPGREKPEPVRIGEAA